MNDRKNDYNLSCVAFTKALSRLRSCVDDYKMIKNGDKIAVGVSGGKDSVLLLCLLANLRRFYPEKFDLEAITLDMGFENADFSEIQRLCDYIDVHYTIVKTQIKEVVFDVRQEKNPCSLCANMRRGALYTNAKALGCNKVALGHNNDDAVETFIMSLFLEGRINCFGPVTYLDRTDITVLRPMLYVKEENIRSLVETARLPIVKNPCPANGNSSREDAKVLLRELEEKYPSVKEMIFGAMKRYPLNNWRADDDR